MYINDAIGNISERYSSPDIRIIYKPNNNLFDLAISLLPYKLYGITDDISGNMNNIKYIPVKDFTLNQYNFELNNSMLGFSNQKKQNTMLGLNTISFCHHEKIPNIKKEDLFLLNNNLMNSHKVFFSKHCMDSWRFTGGNSLVTYGIPLNIVANSSEKKDEILLFNLDNKNIKIIESILSSNDIKYSVANRIDSDLLNKLNECKVCLEMNDHNIINGLFGLACGAHAVLPATPMIQNDFAHLDNLHPFVDINSMIETIKKCLSEPAKTSNIMEEFSFDNFVTSLNTIVQYANTEVVTL